MFETLFTDLLNPDHELLHTARITDWDSFHKGLQI